ncbi:hypothetical protein [Neorhizobium sp. DT-125]|uniref:hypothetical protein n=1 Tax=Neorhizobium sp. DT-125 TaxID=3396163 RepID=UPI003F1CF585
MRMLEELRKKKDVIKTIGPRERVEAQANGVSSYYVDHSVGVGIVEEKPDGTKVLHSYPFAMKPGLHAAE